MSDELRELLAEQHREIVGAMEQSFKLGALVGALAHAEGRLPLRGEQEMMVGTEALLREQLANQGSAFSLLRRSLP